MDILDNSARGLLTSILYMWDKLQRTQQSLKLTPTPLYAIATLYADNASVNTGEVGRLCVFLNTARRKAYLLDHPDSDGCGFKVLLFKGCDDHILALVLASYNRKLVAW